METKSIKIYRFGELDELAKDKVRDGWRANSIPFDGWNEETRESIEAISEALNTTYEYGEDYCNLYTDNIDSDILDLQSVRALAYIENNYIAPNEKGKYYSTAGYTDDAGRYHYKYRRSNCTMEFSCPFTGYYLDGSMDEALKKFKDELRAGNAPTVGDYIGMVEEILSRDLLSDYEYRVSDEYIDEEIAANNKDGWYTEDGEEFEFAKENHNADATNEGVIYVDYDRKPYCELREID